jgi:hypothetical protein
VRVGRGPEVLVDGDFSSFANWTDADDWNEGTLAYDYLFALNSSSLTQVNATLATTPKNNTVYDFTYTVSAIVNLNPVMDIATPFASVATLLTLDQGPGTYTTRFTSGVAADVADFVLSQSGGGTTDDAFTLDDISLREVAVTDLDLTGDLAVTNVALGNGLSDITLTGRETNNVNWTVGGAGAASRFQIGTISGSAVNLRFIRGGAIISEMSSTALSLSTGIDLAWNPDATGNLGTNQAAGRPDSLYVKNRITVGADDDALAGEPIWPHVLNVAFGDVGIVDKSTVTTESLADGADPDSGNWAVAGDFADGTSNVVWTHTGGTASLTQINANLSIVGQNNRYYQFTYTVSSFSGNAPGTAVITSAFAKVNTALDFSANATRTVTFEAAVGADVADFVIEITSSLGGTFVLDSLSLKEVIGGDIHVHGFVGGGGTDGLRIDQNGNTKVPDASWLGWGDTQLHRDGPWELALRDGSNDNFLYIYATHTDASNFERLALYAGGSGNVTMEAQTLGSGQNDINMTIQPAGAGFLQLGPDTIASGNLRFRGGTYQMNLGANDAQITLRSSRVISGALTSGSTHTFTNVIPANSLIKAIFTRITTEVTGPTTILVGDGVDPDRWGVIPALTVGNHTAPGDYTDRVNERPFYTDVAEDVVLTVTGGDFTAGEITCHVIAELVQALSIT